MLRSRHISKLVLLKRPAVPSCSRNRAKPGSSWGCFAEDGQFLRCHSSSSSSRSRSTTLQQQREQEGLTVPQDHALPTTISEAEPDIFVARRTRRQKQKQKPKIKSKEQLQQESHHANQALQLVQQASSQTQDLIQIPQGQMTQEDWRQAHDLIQQYWCITAMPNNNTSKKQKLPRTALEQSVTESWALLERLVQEQQTTNHVSLSKVVLQHNLLELLLRNWKQVCRRRRQASNNSSSNSSSAKDNEVIMTPLEILQKLQDVTQQSTSLRLNARMYNIIMQVALQQGLLLHQQEFKKPLFRPQQLQRRRRTTSSNSSSPGYYSAVEATPQMMETAQFIESVMEQMLVEKTDNPALHPDDVSYATILDAWSLVGDGSRAQYWLQHMLSSQQPSLHRDVFHSVLSAYARGPKTKETQEQCYAVIRQMQELSSSSDVAPNVQTYNWVLTCLANNPLVEDSVAEAETLFRKEMADPNLRDTKSYNLLLDIYAKRGMASQAEVLLEQMYDDYQQQSSRSSSTSSQDRPRRRLVEPDTMSFNIVLSAYKNAGKFGAMERLFALMEELHATQTLKRVAPDYYTYSIVLESWTQQVGKVPDACQRAEAIVHTMKRLAKAGNPSLQPTFVTYSILLKALAKSGDADRAEQVLGKMMDEYLIHKNQRVQPDLTTFNTVLLALSRSDRHDSVSRIQALMKSMENMSKEGTLGQHGTLHPDVRSWNSLLQAMARSGRRGAGEECERTLEQMIEKPDIEVNTISYATAIQAYARHGRAEHAERLLQRLCDEYYKVSNPLMIDDKNGSKGKHPKVQPSVQLFSNVMSSWSKSGKPEAPEKAMALMEQMKNLSMAGDLDGDIDTVCYNALLDAWSNSGKQDAGQQVKAILQEMEGSNSTKAKPDTISYNTALNTFARAGDAKSCEDLLDRMVEKSRVDCSRLKPDVRSLCTVLKGWARSPTIKKDEDRAQIVLEKLQELSSKYSIRATAACYNVALDCLAKTQTKESCQIAEDLVQEMEERVGVQPDIYSYSTLTNAYGSIGEAEKAEALLERLVEDYARRGNQKGAIKPTTRLFNNVLYAWAQKARLQSAPDAPVRAEAILNQMKRFHTTLNLPVKPTLVSYNLVLDCWGKSGLEGSGVRAETILTEMIDAKDEDIVPETRTWNTVMAAYARIGNYKKVEAMLESMREAYSRAQLQGNPSSSGAKPDRLSYNIWMNSLARAKRNDAGERCEAILAEMEAKADTGENDMKPDASSYTTVIGAHTRRQNCERAQALLFQICDAFENDGDTTMKPSVETFRKVLMCVSNQGSDVTGEVALQIRQRMEQIHPGLSDAEVNGSHDGGDSTEKIVASPTN